MSRILLTFANAPGETLLPTLREEYAGIRDALADRDRLGAIRVTTEQHATAVNVIENLETYKEDICLFLYSGHAGPNQLLLEDQQANARGLALLLGECAERGLKAVVLNGCSTYGQVKALLEAGVPIVIATSAPVNDKAATRFSISFFEALSLEGQTLWKAFEAGLRAAQTVSPADLSAAKKVRSIDLTEQEAAPVWGFFCKEANQTLAETWKLPDPPAGDCVCNKHLRQALTGLCNKNERLKAMAGDQTQWPKIALESLPFPLSEPLRKLLATKAQSQEAGQFYDSASWERFSLLLYTYQSVLNLSVYALLGDVWDRRGALEKPPALAEDLRSVLRNTLFKGGAEYRKMSSLSLLHALVGWFGPEAPPPFLKELPKAAALLRDNAVLAKAIADLEQKLAEQEELRRKHGTPAALCALCDATEDSLAKVVFTFGFLADYGLTSVKDIDVLKTRSQKTASFRHRVVKLQISYTELDEEDYKTEKYLENSSIVLHRHGNLKDGVLNLTPFYVDKNALVRAPKANLHQLTGIEPGSGKYFFQPVSRPFDPWIVAPPQEAPTDFYELPAEGAAKSNDEHYALLKEQFEAFGQCFGV